MINYNEKVLKKVIFKKLFFKVTKAATFCQICHYKIVSSHAKKTP